MLTERINTHLRDLSDADKCIWRYIEGNHTEASRASIHELARACAVSSASIVRFAQKLGFDGFGEMKAVMRMEQTRDVLPARDVRAALGSFYDQTWRELMRRDYTRASRLIREAHRIFAYASGYVQSNVMQEMKRLKERGLWFVGADMAGDEDMFHADLTGSLCIVIGSEGKGLGRLVKETCDFLVRIPMHGAINSLNASVAGALLMYEARRARLLGRA